MKIIDHKKLSVGDIITLTVGNIAHGGHFVSRYYNQVIFVRHAITDEIANVKITHVSAKLAFGDAIEIIKRSEYRVKSPCKYSKPDGCGGCDFQHIHIKKQTELKKIIIKDQFKRIAQTDLDPEFISVKPDSGLNWRSRLDLAISDKGRVGLYLHKKKDVIEIDKCLIALNKINDSNIFKKKWNKNHRLSLTVSSENELSINQSGKTIIGSNYLEEKVGEYTYLLSSKSFWQSHKNAPDILIQKVMEYSQIRQGDKICDLYGGVGLFTSPLAKSTGKNGEVHLIENNHHCIRDAIKIFKNKKNIIIHNGKVEKKIQRIKNVDIIILDPPRNGAGEKVTQQMIKKNPRSIVYVSCNPASLARDAKTLIDNYYTLEKIIGIDLFPMTHHIECIALFTKK